LHDLLFFSLGTLSVETIIPFDITIPDLQAFSFVGLPAGGIMDSRQPGNDYVEKQDLLSSDVLGVL
jgi:hypothetical protein